MNECKTINCPTCNFEVAETFLEQKCPRCQTLIESKFICGSCNSCHDSLTEEKDKNLLTKIFSFLQK